MGVAALVLGIIGTIFSVVFFPLGLVMSLVALILGIVGRKSAAENGQPTGSSTAGLALGVVGLALGALMWMWCHSCAVKGQHFSDELRKGFEEAKKVNSGKPLSGEVIKVSPAQLLADYQANELAADGKYKDKTLELTGTVSTVSKDAFDNVFFTLSGGDDNMREVEIFLDAANVGKAAALTRGQKVTVQGRGDGQFLNARVKDAVLK